jgi:hypothetical protein
VEFDQSAADALHDIGTGVPVFFLAGMPEGALVCLVEQSHGNDMRRCGGIFFPQFHHSLRM